MIQKPTLQTEGLPVAIAISLILWLGIIYAVYCVMK